MSDGEADRSPYKGVHNLGWMMWPVTVVAANVLYLHTNMSEAHVVVHPFKLPKVVESLLRCWLIICYGGIGCTFDALRGKEKKGNSSAKSSSASEAVAVQLLLLFEAAL